MTIRVNGNEFEIERMEGNDECFEMNEFYQIGYTASGNEYRFFFDITDEDGEEYTDLGNVDYTNAYRAEIAIRDEDGDLLRYEDTERYYDSAVKLMDDELREEIHASGDFDGDPEGFLREYEARHFKKFGEEFTF